MDHKIICLVSLHGVGFQEPPQTNIPDSGYADPLHEHLKVLLGDQLSDDPGRQRTQPGENGAIYVQSRWQDEVSGRSSIENGLRRLGSWNPARLQVDTENAPLIADNEPFSHIALVYSNLEPQPHYIRAALLAAWTSLCSLWNYTTLRGLLGLLAGSIRAALTPTKQGGGETHNGYPRADGPLGFIGLLRAGFVSLADDVACYAYDNDERERVRSFLGEALTRLAYRPDVEQIVLNTHSNGSVIAFDVLRHLPLEVTSKIRAIVSGGSPLRKYVDLFAWGNEVQTRYTMEPWYNFIDLRDPLGDRLQPPASWKLGEKLPPPESGTLFQRIDLNSELPYPIHMLDIIVDNVKWSTGSNLRAHNYWDNQEQFVPRLANIMRALLARQSNSRLDQPGNIS